MNRRRGFTLIEVLVALVVMGAAVAVLAQGFVLGTRASERAQRKTVGAELASAKMAELEAGILAVHLSQAGEFADAPGWSWEIVSTAATDAPGLYHVSVTARWSERGYEEPYTLVRLMRERASP